MATTTKRKSRDLTGLKFAFFGQFAYWPSYHGSPPAETAERLGATVQKDVTEDLDYLVLGDKRGAGRADAKKKAEKFQARAKKEAGGEKSKSVKIIDEAKFRDMVKADVRNMVFAFAGGFDCCPQGFDDSLLSKMVEAVGGKVQTQVDETVDYLVLGNRRGLGKTAAHNKAKALRDAGAALEIIGEEGFLELVRRETKARSKLDFASFVGNLYGVVDKGKLQRAIKMLKEESFQLYSKVNDDSLLGVVRSQSGAGTVYSPWLTSDGHYGCSTPELEDCMGLQGTVCKHLLVLLVGLTRTGNLDPNTADGWIRAAAKRRPGRDVEKAAETFLQYKGAQAGEIDWRPTETIPEDFYAL
jgi:hypothetical protein